jgi:hypothetical protein
MVVMGNLGTDSKMKFVETGKYRLCNEEENEMGIS